MTVRPSARCGYPIDDWANLFTRVLLRESWTERTTLNA
jgi:hypothetical protein